MLLYLLIVCSFFIAELYSTAQMSCTMFTHLTFNGHLCYFQVLVFMNKAIINIHIQVFV